MRVHEFIYHIRKDVSLTADMQVSMATAAVAERMAKSKASYKGQGEPNICINKEDDLCTL